MVKVSLKITEIGGMLSYEKVIIQLDVIPIDIENLFKELKHDTKHIPDNIQYIIEINGEKIKINESDLSDEILDIIDDFRAR